MIKKNTKIGRPAPSKRLDLNNPTVGKNNGFQKWRFESVETSENGVYANFDVLVPSTTVRVDVTDGSLYSNYKYEASETYSSNHFELSLIDSDNNNLGKSTGAPSGDCAYRTFNFDLFSSVRSIEQHMDYIRLSQVNNDFYECGGGGFHHTCCFNLYFKEEELKITGRTYGTDHYRVY